MKLVKATITSALVGAAVLAPGVGAVAAPSGTAPRVNSSTVVHYTDTNKLPVLYNGTRLTPEQADQKQAQAGANGQAFVIVYDPNAAAQGFAHAFDSPAQADAYGQSIKGVVSYAPGSSAREAMAQPMATLPTTCTSKTNIHYLYDGYNCVGDAFALSLNDDERYLSTYGWANKANSLLVGNATQGCQASVRLYLGPNYSLTYQEYYGTLGRTEYYRFNDVQTNNYESAKATCS